MEEQSFLSKTHILIAIVVGILAPSITAVSAFYTAKSSLQNEIADMKLDNIKSFAGKRDVENISLRLDNMNQQISIMNSTLVEMRTIMKTSRR